MQAFFSNFLKSAINAAYQTEIDPERPVPSANPAENAGERGPISAFFDAFLPFLIEWTSGKKRKRPEFEES